MNVRCKSFSDNTMIPKKHTGYGEDISPEFIISDIPDGTVSFAIILDDLDVPWHKDYNHWIIWNIPRMELIPEGLPKGGNISKPTFHINAGYEHKTELERLKLYIDENNVDIRDFSCVPEMIMKPLQTTKATRYLCYKLIEGEINTLYFNGKDGDFYLKASRDTLMLHCRDMAFVFGESYGAKDLVEENDTINIFDKSDDDYNINDIFSIAYEMIFILAGAGEVLYEQMSDGVLKISLEKEYVEDYSRQFGKVIFDIKEEKCLL